MERRLADDLPNDIDALKTALVAARRHAAAVESELTASRAQRSDDQALITHLRLVIAKLNGERFGPRSERTGAFSTSWTSTGGTGGLGERGRSGRRDGGGEDDDRCGLHAPASGPRCH